MYADLNRVFIQKIVDMLSKPGYLWNSLWFYQQLRGKDMEQAFIDRMEESLSELKSEIISNLLVNNEDFKEIVEGMDPKDLADIASDDIDRKMIEAIGSQEMKRLKLIESALTRIKQGKYGLCIKCGKRIPQDRLEAIPYALMCIDCKTAEERRNR
jgi:RNA polymerase-binding protein DksA